MNLSAYKITEFKAADGPKGLFAALVSVFGNVDRNGDRVMPGAFTRTLERWRESGKKIPVIFSHDHNDPESFIGEVDPNDVQQTADGLVVAGRFDMENPKARQVFDLLSRHLINDWSFAYQVEKEKIADDLARDVLQADLFEIGPTLIGANGKTQTLQLASANFGETTTTVTAPVTTTTTVTASNTTGAGWTLTEVPDALSVEEKATPEATAKITSRLDDVVASALDRFEDHLDAAIEEKIGRVLSAKTETKLRSAMAALEDVLSAIGEDSPDLVPQSSANTEEAKPPSESEVRRRSIDKVGLFLAERTK